MELNKMELLNTNGGAIKWTLGLAIAGGITFIMGFIDGIIRPLKCR